MVEVLQHHSMTDFSLPACLSDDGDGSAYAMDFYLSVFVCLCVSLMYCG